MSNTTPVENYIRLTRLIRAPRQQVYEAWLDPEVRSQWWCASPEMSCGGCQIDANVGGDYRLTMINEGEEYVTVGKFLELDPPNKLVFTWTWEGRDFGADSQVTIELFGAEFEGRPATELRLIHERLNSPLERSDHTTGWLGCLKSLGKMFADLDVPA